MFCLLIASTLYARSSHAQATPEAIAWTYGAPPECPPAETFEREFHARTTRAELDANGTNTSRRFAVSLSTEPGRASGRLEVRGPGDALAVRELSAQTCTGVVSALALIAALIVDPLAAESSTERSQPAAARTAAHPAPLVRPEAAVSTAPRAAVSGAPWARAAGAGGLDWNAAFGLFPKTTPSATLFGEATLERDSPVAPSVRVSLSGAVSASVSAPVGSARFRWLAAALDACPFELRLARALRASPCLFGEAGVLEGSGSGVATPEVERRRWLAVGGSARLKWLFSGSFFLEAQARLEAPLARDTFVLEVPERVVLHAVPVVLGSLGLGLGVRWP